MQKIIKCPRCEKYTNPIEGATINSEHQHGKRCEFCGWKVLR